VGELRTVSGLEVGQEAEPVLVEGPVAGPAERHHAVGLVAAAERARDEVRRVARHPPADGTAGAGDLLALSG
jgi:hypothetical protein